MAIARVEKGVVVEIIEDKRMADIPVHKRDSFARIVDVTPAIDSSLNYYGPVTYTVVDGVAQKSREVIPHSPRIQKEAVNNEAMRRIMAITNDEDLFGTLAYQLNMHSRINELRDLKDEGKLTPEDQLELDDLRATARAIQAVRKNAKLLKGGETVPTDYKDDKYWA